MNYIVGFFMLCCGYYTLTYGICVWKEKNRLGGVGAVLLAVLGTGIPLLLAYYEMRDRPLKLIAAGLYG